MGDTAKEEEEEVGDRGRERLNPGDGGGREEKEGRDAARGDSTNESSTIIS